MKALLKIRALVAQLWSAVTRHRFVRRADLSARQRRAERRAGSPERTVPVRIVPITIVDGDKSPAKSADMAVRAPASRRSTVRMRTRKSVEAFLELRLSIAAWLAPKPVWRRYRVTPRANPAAFRHDLLRGIQHELRRAGLVTSQQVASRTTL